MTKLPKNVDLLIPSLPTPLILIENEITRFAEVKLYIKRDDLIHDTVSGNKWRKLKYNLLDAKDKGFQSLLTFGGAYSNHLYAVAAAGAGMGFGTIGIVRGEDHEIRETATIQFCKDRGMAIHYVSRAEYKKRNDQDYIEEISSLYGSPYVIPEGGTTALALPGVQEMVEETRQQLGFSPDYFSVAAGTGGTAAGILSAGEKVLAFAALKGGSFLENDIFKLSGNIKEDGQLSLFTDYHFGGYAKWNYELLHFIKHFKVAHRIQLEQVYTAKMLYGLYDLLISKYFPVGTTIVAVHTGGLQGLLPDLVDV
ncbi:pyridoxal-phosphate dependent enzyme [Dyadobacter sp. 32]|uniref:1-aminocyclopropane-1-carboxylate deaminase/D-cysteine desulfhydrase n=1 Tax=Dyadobacter sp. 32 TaxID=538966 RepID=UPI0011EF0865